MKEIDYEAILDVIDTPDSRDYLYEDFMKEYSEWVPHKIWDKNKIEIWDQFDQPTTYKACTCYWLTGIYNWYNVAEWEKYWKEFKQENPRWKWEAYQATRWRPNKWSSLQAMMKFFKSRKLIDWYLRATTIEWMKNAIDNWFEIYTWTNSCSWRATWKAWVFTYKKNGGWHCFYLADYNDKWFLAVNSFWKDWGDEGAFIVPYKDVRYLFTTYVIIDHDDKWVLEKLNFDREYEEAIKLWITNWTRPDDPASRKEVAVMNYRLYKMLKKS